MNELLIEAFHKPKQSMINLIQITDSHLLASADEEMAGINNQLSLENVLQQIQQSHADVDAILHTGDVAQEPTAETYNNYCKTMESIDSPHFMIAGNHDDTKYFPHYYSDPRQPVWIRLGEWHLVLLNSSLEGCIDGYFDQKQLEQLEQLLAHIEQCGGHTIIACHHHPIKMNSEWLDRHRLKTSDQFLAILRQFKHVRIVLFGHVHQEFHQSLDGIEFFACPSTAMQFKPNSHDFLVDTVNAGYRLLQLYPDGEFATEVFRVKSKNYAPVMDFSGY